MACIFSFFPAGQQARVIYFDLKKLLLQSAFDRNRGIVLITNLGYGWKRVQVLITLFMVAVEQWKKAEFCLKLKKAADSNDFNLTCHVFRIQDAVA